MSETSAARSVWYCIFEKQAKNVIEKAWWCDFFRFSENSKQVVISLPHQGRLFSFTFAEPTKNRAQCFICDFFAHYSEQHSSPNSQTPFVPWLSSELRRMQTLESPIKSCTWNLLPIPPPFLPLLVLMTGRAVDWVGGCSCSCRTFFANSWFFCCHRLREVGRVQNLNELSWTSFHHVCFLAQHFASPVLDSEHLSVVGSIHLLVQFLLDKATELFSGL